MAKRQAYILQSSEDGRRHLCIDIANENEIFGFLNEDKARIKKFRQIRDIILRGLRVTELYDKEEIDSKSKNVTAMKLFKGGQNIRIYCKEQRSITGTFYVIVAELLRKKKDQKIKEKNRTLIHKVGSYEYEIVERR
ncbi:hypothetical protein [Terrimonas ferruginea]|uniref:hypothetical protein n=1 Tax=Terrimonas ferruginea TaxID=249 RepID=UPI00041203B3|nr:hypothetical protein [Terrimonas ferruginea]